MSGRDTHVELPVDPDPSDIGHPPRPLHLEPAMLAAVAAGGLLGTPARYELGQVLLTPTHGWPLATFAVNLAGAFALGLLLALLARRGPDRGRRRLARLAVGTGALGAFTTYSALAVETDLLVRDGRVALGLAYALASVAAGLATTIAGIRLGAGRQ